MDDNATGAEFYTSERDTPGNIVFNIVVNVQLRQSQGLKTLDQEAFNKKFRE